MCVNVIDLAQMSSLYYSLTSSSFNPRIPGLIPGLAVSRNLMMLVLVVGYRGVVFQIPQRHYLLMRYGLLSILTSFFIEIGLKMRQSQLKKNDSNKGVCGGHENSNLSHIFCLTPYLIDLVFICISLR